MARSLFTFDDNEMRNATVASLTRVLVEKNRCYVGPPFKQGLRPEHSRSIPGLVYNLNFHS